MYAALFYDRQGFVQTVQCTARATVIKARKYASVLTSFAMVLWRAGSYQILSVAVSYDI